MRFVFHRLGPGSECAPKWHDACSRAGWRSSVETKQQGLDSVTADDARAACGGAYAIRDVFGRTIWSGDAVSLQAALRQAAAVTSLAGADLSGLDLEGVVLEGADLHGANFTGADLDGARLSGATLSGASFSNASLCGADLTLANLTGASLDGAIVIAAKLDPEDIPHGFEIEDGRVRRTLEERTRLARLVWREARDRAIGKSRLSRLLVDRTVDYYADHRPSLPTEPERLRLDELGAQVYAFLRYRATGAFLEAHRTDDGYDLTIAALSEDDEMRRHIERRLGRRVLEDGELRLARTRSDREES